MCNQEKKVKRITRTSYSLTEKRSILDLYFKSGLSCRQFALQHGIERSTLSLWLSSCKNAENTVLLYYYIEAFPLSAAGVLIAALPACFLVDDSATLALPLRKGSLLMDS